MRLVLDQGLPRSAIPRLQEAGIEALHVGDIGLSAADDAEILERARRDGSEVVTLDADFHASMPSRYSMVKSALVLFDPALGNEHVAV